MRGLRGWLVAVLVVTVVTSVGLPLVGARVFLASDNLFLHAPWAEQAPADLRPTNPLLADTVDAVTPRRAEFARRVRQGDLPLWTSNPASGVPLAAQTNGGLLSPLNVAWLVLPVRYAPAATKVIELAVAIGFTYLFLRRLRLGRAAGLMGGLLYAFSGFQVVWTNWPQAAVGATIPALFWAVDRAIDRRTAGSVGVVAAVTAVLMLGGFPAVAAYALIGAGVYALVRVLADPTSRTAADVRGLASLAGGVALGLALSAFQVLPFLSRLGGVELGYREQSGASHLPAEALATTVVPNAFGSPVDRVGLGGIPGAPVNYVEYQSFLGAVALVLVFLAAVRWRRRALPRGVWSFLWGSLGVLLMLMYVGGPALELLQDLPFTRPVFGINNIGRMRSIMGLIVAVLAAGGFQTIVDRGSVGRHRTLTAVAAAVAAVTAAFLTVRVLELSTRGGLGTYVLEQAAVPLAVLGVAVAVVALDRRLEPGGVPLAAWVLPVLFTVEVLAFAGPFWPRIPHDQFYPETPAHRFLIGNLGSDRIAAEHRTLYPGTTSYYGLRSVTAHAFQPPAWADLLEAADEHAFDRGYDTPRVRSATFPHLRAHPDVITSPVLDRLGVRYFATGPHVPVIGALQEATAAPSGTTTMDGGASVEVPVPRTDLRGVVIHLAEPFAGASDIARLRVELLDSDGEPLGSGTRRLYPVDPPVQLLAGGDPFATGESGPFAGERPGPFHVALSEPAWEPTRPETPGTLRITYDAPDGVLALVTGEGGEPVVDLVTPTDDGLRVAFSDGTVLYERTRWLPRVRWAGRAEVVEDADRRVQQLTSGVPPETVLLNAPGPRGSGGGARVEVLEDSGDAIVADVNAEGDGFLVIAEMIHRGWHATVDGEPAEIRPADHALAAVHVPAGDHRVEVRYEPREWANGLVVSGVAAIALVALLIVAVRRRRPEPDAEPHDVGDRRDLTKAGTS